MTIGIRSIAVKLVATNVSTATLNCTSGGDFSPAPQLGDFIFVSTMMQDDSGAPAFTPPAGWTNVGFAQGIAIDSPEAMRRLGSRRFATSPESTYTWTSTTFGGATVTSWIILGVCLTGILNPYQPDTGPFSLTNQGDRNPQAASNLSVQLPDSVVISTWGTNPQFTQPYVSVAAINGVSATFLRDADGFSCMGIWLAPGTGLWTPTATRGVNVQGHWGTLDLAIKATPLPSPVVKLTANYGIIPSFVDHRHRHHAGSTGI